MSVTARGVSAVLVVVAVILVLTTCGDDDPSGTGAGEPTPSAAGGQPTATGPAPIVTVSHNEADVLFAAQLAIHHRQGVEIAGLAVDHASDTAVAELAERIQLNQRSEISIVTGWLQSWGEPVPGASPDGKPHGYATPSLLAAQEITLLEDASDADFDRLFLELMIRHHRNGVALAENEREQGVHPLALELAGEIVSGQTEEIAEMRGLLDRVPVPSASVSAS